MKNTIEQSLQKNDTIASEADIRCNPLSLLLIIGVTIFTTELLIMIILWYLPPLKPLHQALLDASTLSLIVFPSLYFFVFRPLTLQIRQRRLVEAEKDELITNLQQALDEVKTLQGIIPICSSCKKVRDDMGYWHQVESYVSSHSSALFSHGLCPGCAKELYPDLAEDLEMN